MLNPCRCFPCHTCSLNSNTCEIWFSFFLEMWEPNIYLLVTATIHTLPYKQQAC